jgi:hypothetical protein
MTHDLDLRQKNFKQVKLFLLGNMLLLFRILSSIDLLDSETGKIRSVIREGAQRKLCICPRCFSPCPVGLIGRYQNTLRFVG